MKKKRRRIKSPRVQQKNMLNRRRRRQIWFRIATIAASVAVAVLTISEFFHVEQFVISGETRYEQQDLLDALPVKQGDSLIFLDKQDAENRLQQVFPYLEQIVLVRKFPDTLELQLTERKPIVAVQQGERYYLLDAAGKVLEQKNADGLGDITQVIGIGELSFTVGSTVPVQGYEKLWVVLDFLELMQKYELSDRVNSIDITKLYEVYLQFDQRYRVEFGSVDDMELVEYKIQFLQAVLKKDSLPMSGVIDLSDGEKASYRPFTGEDITAREEDEQDAEQTDTASEQDSLTESSESDQPEQQDVPAETTEQTENMTAQQETDEESAERQE